MYFSNRWVPMEVMNTIVLLWAIAVFIVGGILFRLWYMDRVAKLKEDRVPHVAGVKGKKRRRRR